MSFPSDEGCPKGGVGLLLDVAPLGLLYPERSRGVHIYSGFSSRLRSTNSFSRGLHPERSRRFIYTAGSRLGFARRTVSAEVCTPSGAEGSYIQLVLVSASLDEQLMNEAEDCTPSEAEELFLISSIFH